MNYKIYDYVNPSQALNPTETPDTIIFPEQLNTHLPKKTFIALGERVKTLYYAPNSNYSEPIIRVTYVFTRDAKGYLTNKEKTISWTLEDGSWGTEVKSLSIPVTSVLERESEITRRRKNIVNELKVLAGQMGIREYMTALFNKYGAETYNYENGGTDILWKAIEADTELPFLNANLPNGRNARTAITDYLKIGVIN